jgi:hypothetical protein
MSAEETSQHRHGRHAFIPAGVLIGLGVGLLAGFPGSGVLIGLGLGFIATALMPAESTAGTGTSCPLCLTEKNMIMLLIGIFMIIIGVGIVIAPPQIWSYAVPAFLILIGIWFALRGFRSHT